LRTNLLIIALVCFILLTSCKTNQEYQQEREDAWYACNSATGDPTGKNVTGMVFEVDSINGGPLDNAFMEVIYGKMGASGPVFHYPQYENLTHDLSKASAILCAEVTTRWTNSCKYPNDTDVQFTERYYKTEAYLSLISWPLGELIAQTVLEVNQYEDRSCPFYATYESGEKSRDVFSKVDLKAWLDQYITVVE